MAITRKVKTEEELKKEFMSLVDSLLREVLLEENLQYKTAVIEETARRMGAENVEHYGSLTEQDRVVLQAARDAFDELVKQGLVDYTPCHPLVVKLPRCYPSI